MHGKPDWVKQLTNSSSAFNKQNGDTAGNTTIATAAIVTLRHDDFGHLLKMAHQGESVLPFASIATAGILLVTKLEATLGL